MPKKIRYLFRFFKAIFKKQYKNIVLGLLFGILFYFVSPLIFKIIPKPKYILTLGKVGRYKVNEIPDSILKDISLGLTTLSDKGEILPALAKNWTIEDAGKTYIFEIADTSIYWHDGQKLKPEDINYNFNDVDFKVENNKLIFKLKEPFAPFLSVVSKPIFKKGLIGTGQYKVSKVNKSGNYVKSILLTPFDSENKLPKKRYRFYNSESDLKTAFNLGEIDFAEDLFSNEGFLFNNNDSVEETINKNIYVALLFDNSKPFLETKSFRQALAYAIPKEKGELRALNPISPVSWAYNPDVKPYNEDIARAKELLAKDESDYSSLNLSIYSFPQYEKIAKTVKESWEKIGIKSEVFITTFIPPSFDVLLIGREIPKDPDQYYFWHTTQPGNITKFKNPRIDKLLEDGRKTDDQEKRKDIYYDFQRFLNEEVPAVFLFHPITYNIIRNSVFQFNQ